MFDRAPKQFEDRLRRLWSAAKQPSSSLSTTEPITVATASGRRRGTHEIGKIYQISD